MTALRVAAAVVHVARSRRAGLSRGLVKLVLLAAQVVALQAATASAPAAPAVSTDPVPRANCGAGSLPEVGRQGRVSTADVESGRARKGYFCNTRVVGHLPGGSNFKTLRYIDLRGNECAYFDTPQDHAAKGLGGVQVLDMSSPNKPRQTASLTTPAMLSPHESLLLNVRRGLLVAVMGAPGTAPGVLDVYDLSLDCRRPVLRSSTPVGVLGHESGFAPDGRTFYVSSQVPAGGIVAVDLTDPSQPRISTLLNGPALHGLRLSGDGNTLYATDLDQRVSAGAPSGPGVLATPGLRVYDVSEVQRRLPNPRIVEIGRVDWPEKSYPQVAEPVTINGRRYVLEIDEFASRRGNVGAARMIDVHDPRRPRVVSNIRLEVHTAAAQADEQRNDAPPGLTGYGGHYCAVPRLADPKIVACSFIRSGIRIFDIRNPEKPREVAYFNPPGQDGGETLVAPAFAPERNEIWYTDRRSGFWVFRVTNGAWPGNRGGIMRATKPASSPAGSSWLPRMP